MSRVIKRVPREVIEIPTRSAMCYPCGSGWSIEEGHPTYETNLAKIGMPCGSCGEPYVEDHGTEVYTNAAYVLVECDCGEEIQCSGFTTTCSCGADYNWNGERLADREQWGEDTGEHWTDCY